MVNPPAVDASGAAWAESAGDGVDVSASERVAADARTVAIDVEVGAETVSDASGLCIDSVGVATL
jgi:hypothetical protein